MGSWFDYGFKIDCGLVCAALPDINMRADVCSVPIYIANIIQSCIYQSAITHNQNYIDSTHQDNITLSTVKHCTTTILYCNCDKNLNDCWNMVVITNICWVALTLYYVIHTLHEHYLMYMSIINYFPHACRDSVL